MSDAINSSPEQQENQLETTLPDFQELMKKHRNIASALKVYLEPFCGRVAAFNQGPTPEADRARFDRIFRPWPKWVFRLGADLWHVDYPTIDREVFLETFRVINVMLHRCPTDPEARTIPVSRKDVFDRVDFRVLPLILAAFLGHSFEHVESHRKQLDEKFSKGEISKEDYEKGIKSNPSETIEKTCREFLAGWTKDEDAKPFELMRTVEEARRKTFDKNGLPKETPLIPIYRAMLHNWVKIENMSGPKELAAFLTPQLKGNSKSATGEITRIATLCSRLGLKFRAKSRTFDLHRRPASV